MMCSLTIVLVELNGITVHFRSLSWMKFIYVLNGFFRIRLWGLVKARHGAIVVVGVW